MYVRYSAAEERMLFSSGVFFLLITITAFRFVWNYLHDIANIAF